MDAPTTELIENGKPARDGGDQGAPKHLQRTPTPRGAQQGRAVHAAGGAAAASSVLAACGGGSGDDPAGTVGTAGSGQALGPGAVPASDKEAARFLQQAQFSCTDDEIEQLRTQGYVAWLDQQMALPIGQTAWDWLIAHHYNREDIVYNAHYADFVTWQQLIEPPDAVRKRMALALSEIMVVSTSSMDDESPAFAMAAYWDLLNRNAFGNYRTLLGEITLNPAMGKFLSTLNNLKEDPKTGRAPDENFAREVMQLFTIGLYQLNRDGTPKLGSNGQPIETYNNNDITGLAHVFTGFQYDETGHVRAIQPERVRNPMKITASRHSTMDATFLGTTVAGSMAPKDEVERALDVIFNHPNVAPFVSRQLIQRLVTGTPSPAYVDRVAAVFENDGAGVRGDLKAVVKAILLDPEARTDPALQPATWGKLREPMVRWVQWARTFGARNTDGEWIVWDKSDPSTGLGQSPLRSPSVFNFFRPGYVPPNSAMAKIGLTSPEFEITNEVSVAGYVNFMSGAISYGVWGNDASKVIVDSYTRELALVNDPAALVDRLNLLLAAGGLSDATVAAIRDAVASINPNSDYARNTRVWAAILLAMAHPEYIVQK